MYDSAKPWQRRDPGRNLHVGRAAQTVGRVRNLPYHMRCNLLANPRCGAPATLPWLARRPAPRPRVVGPIAAALRLRTGGPVASPVRRTACARPCSRGVRTCECSQSSRRSEAPRPANRPPTLSPLARYRRHISHGRRQAKTRCQEARRQEGGREEVRSCVEYATRSSLTGPHAGRPPRSPRRRRAPRSSMRRPDAISMLFP